MNIDGKPSWNQRSRSMERDIGYMVDILDSAKLAVEYLDGVDKA
jgi:hypothetical protein